jgi:hypothetical protein
MADHSPGRHHLPDTSFAGMVNNVCHGIPDHLLSVLQHVGGCVRLQKVTDALYRGYHAGLDI